MVKTILRNENKGEAEDMEVGEGGESVPGRPNKVLFGYTYTVMYVAYIS